MSKHQLFSGEVVNSVSDIDSRIKVSILLTEEFSLLSLASLTDVFDAVKTDCGQSRIQVRLLSVDGHPVRSRSGRCVHPDGALESEVNLLNRRSRSHTVVICSGSADLSKEEERATLKFVRWSQLAAAPVCIMGAAIRVVAQSGRMTRGTDHWTRIAANREVAPQVEFSNAIFVEDGNVVSCCGELGAMDFALNWVKEQISPQVAMQIRNHLLVTSARSSDREQTCTAADVYHSAPELLQRVIDLMLQNLEEPLSVSEIARNVNVSVRQVERLFARYLLTSPLKFYRAKRLGQARILIEDTNMSVTEVALACGFSSLSVFARSFRKQFGFSPSKLRAA